MQCDPIQLENIAINFLAFADDIVLLSTSQSGLQYSLNLFEKYCSKWRLTVNMKKTKVIIFNSSKIKAKFYFCNVKISEAKDYTYLGIVFKKDGSMCHAMKVLNSKALKAQFSLKQTFYNGNPKVLLKLYDSLIKPISLYGSEVWAQDILKWNECSMDQILLNESYLFDKTFMRLCKHSLKVNKSCSNLPVRGELGVYPLIIQVCISMLKFWLHSRQSPKESIIYKVTNIEKSKQEPNFKTIINKITGLDLDFASLDKKGSDSLIANVKSKLKSMYEQLFFNKINVSDDSPSKFRVYNKWKKNYIFEKYLYNNVPNKEYLTKIRLSCHSFPIEVGRWFRVDKTKRLCYLCKQNVIGDEMHVLFECNNTELKEARNKFMSLIGNKSHQTFMLDNKSLFIYCMLGHDNAIISTICNYMKRVIDITYNLKKQFSDRELRIWFDK